MGNPLDLPVAEAAARVRDPKDFLTARALVELSLKRIEALEPKVNAFLSVTSDLARAQAKAVDETVARGEDPGPLAGIPLAVKDNLAVPGVPLTCGSRILQGYVPPTYATAVERAVAAGCCIVGKTNLDEFAMGSSTENSAFGPSRNPYDLTRVPGGSSGGSAAAVASGLAPLALGSDTGGSIRQPAALCGIVGVKPSYGRVSRSGLVAFASSLDQVGPFARTVADAALLLGVIAGPDPRDATSTLFEHGVAPAAGFRWKGLKVGIPEELERASVEGDPAMAEAFARARDTLKALGAKIVRLSIPLAVEGIPIYYVVAPAEASSNLARYDGVRYGLRVPAESLNPMYAATRDQGFGAEVKRRILLGTFALAAGYADAYYKKAMAARVLLRDQFRDAFGKADVLLSATSPFPAFPIGEKADDPLAMYLCDVLTVAANLAGIPAASIPCGRTPDGLPLGLQVLGAMGREDLVLAACAGLEAALHTPYAPPAILKEVEP